jgi:hypothetical protein
MLLKEEADPSSRSELTLSKSGWMEKERGFKVKLAIK